MHSHTLGCFLVRFPLPPRLYQQRIYSPILINRVTYWKGSNQDVEVKSEDSVRHDNKKPSLPREIRVHSLKRNAPYWSRGTLDRVTLQETPSQSGKDMDSGGGQ